MSVVIENCAYVLIHVPDLIRYGSKPSRDIEDDGGVLEKIKERTRTFKEVVEYPPNQVFIGNRHPEDLNDVSQPWYRHLIEGAVRYGPFGEIMTEDEFYGWLKIADDFDLVWLAASFTEQIERKVPNHQCVTDQYIKKLGQGMPRGKIEREVSENSALPLFLGDSVVGCVRRDHDRDDALKASVLMENLIAKASGALVLSHLLRRAGRRATDVDLIIDCSETAVGDRYNRGGGSLSKAIGEMCQCTNATGYDVKAFCAAPLYALVNAAGLVESGIFKTVVVVGGGCLSKIGMKYSSHMKTNMPVLEDVLGGIAFLIRQDDGLNPVVRLDSVGRHEIGAGSSQQAIMSSLIVKPLHRLGIKMLEIDRYATELHNPEVTLPSGSGNTPYTNYRLMGALAVQNNEIDRTEIEKFVRERGMHGFAPTQGHVPAAVPFLGHAREDMLRGTLRRVMFVAKGSLFLGRMSHLSDGLSFLLEANSKI